MTNMRFPEDILHPKDIILKDGKVRLTPTQSYNYKVYVNNQHIKTILLKNPDTPTEEEIYAALRESGIEPDEL